MTTLNICSHLDQIKDITRQSDGCAKCVAVGDTWTALRMCLTCSHVGCCDSSKNRHATKHFNETKHPIIQSVEPGQDWKWCYIDEQYV
jgi:uncharacterized UBP type Zn finger protein